MIPINVLTSTAVPLPLPNIDTDQIIPKQFLKRIERTGYGDFLFYDWRRIQDGPDAGKPDPPSSSTTPPTRARRSSSPSKNFGCGSSREHAAWALNRLRLPRRHRAHLRRHLLLQRRQERHHPRPPQRRGRANPPRPLAPRTPRTRLTINLEAQTVTDDQGFNAHFDIDPFRKYCLLNGLDDIGLTLRHAAALDTFESAHDTEFWLTPRVGTRST